MAGRLPATEPNDNPLNNLRFLAEQMATEVTLKKCRGLLALARIDTEDKRAGIRLEQFIRSVRITDELARAARDFIGLWDKTPEEIDQILQKEAQGKKLNITKVMPRQIVAGDTLGINYQTFRKVQMASLEALLTVLEGAAPAHEERAVNQAQPENARGHVSSPEYVHRSHIEAQFNLLTAQGAKLIAFVGLPGMGKTSLARELAADGPFIEFQESRPNITYLQAALERYGLGNYVASEQNTSAMLAKLMCVESGPQFVVLDNLRSTGELRALVPPNTSTVVIATCREVGETMPAWCHEIPVDIMTLDEATQLVNLRIPSLGHDEAALAATALGYYPLVIHTACGYANGTGVRLREFCRALATTPDGVKTTTGETLQKILSDTVAALRERNPFAVQLLACAVTYTHPPIMRDRLLAVACEHYGYDIGPIKFAEAISELQKFFLVEVKRDPDYDEWVRKQRKLAESAGAAGHDELIGFAVSPNFPLVYTHPLVNTILANLLQDEAAQVAAMVYQCLARLIEQSKAAAEQNPPDRYELYDISRPVSLLNALSGSGRDFFIEYGEIAYPNTINRAYVNPQDGE